MNTDLLVTIENSKKYPLLNHHQLEGKIEKEFGSGVVRLLMITSDETEHSEAIEISSQIFRSAVGRGVLGGFGIQAVGELLTKYKICKSPNYFGAAGFCIGFAGKSILDFMALPKNERFKNWKEQAIKQEKYTMYRNYAKAYFSDCKEWYCPLLGDMPIYPVQTLSGDVYDKRTLEPILERSDEEIKNLEYDLSQISQFEFSKRIELSNKINQCKEKAMPGKIYCEKKKLSYADEFYDKVQVKVAQFIQQQIPEAYPDPESDSDPSTGFVLTEDGLFPSIKYIPENFIISAFKSFFLSSTTDDDSVESPRTTVTITNKTPSPFDDVLKKMGMNPSITNERDIFIEQPK